MANISFITKFNLVLSPKQFIFQDTTDYVGQGIALVNVNGVFKIVSPSGTTIYNNVDYTNSGCDIRNSVARTGQQVVQLPLGTNDYPEAGLYTIIYTVYDNNLAEYYTITNTYTYAYTTPVVCINQTTDCISPLFTSTDTTVYAVNGITPTISEVHTIYYPEGSAGAGSPVVGSTLVVSTGTFYNGTQTTVITSGLTYVFGDGLIIIDSITGSKEALVDCSDTCNIYCCLKVLECEMISQRTQNYNLYLETRSLFSQIMGLIGMVTLARVCNKAADISSYLTEIKSLAHCTDACNCTGPTPSQVMGIGGLVNSVVVQSGGDPVIVTPVTVGSTTTYTVSLTDAFIATVAGLHNSIVAAGANITVTPVTNLDGSITYTVAGAALTVPPTVLYNNQNPVTTGLGTLTVLKSYTLPINQLATDGDVLEFYCELDSSGISQIKEIDFRIGGTVAHTKVSVFKMQANITDVKLIIRVTRQSATTLYIDFKVLNYVKSYQTNGGYGFFETGFSVSDLSANTTLFEVRGRNVTAGGETITAHQLEVSYFKK